MSRSARHLCAVALVALSLACTHRFFQFRPERDTGARVDAAALALTGPAPAGPLDLAGRDALLTVLRHVAAEQVKLEPPSRGLLLASALTLSGGGPAATAGERGGLVTGVLALLEARLAKALDLEDAPRGLLQGLAKEPVGEPPARREQELLARTAALDLGDCHADAPRVAYRGSLLGHVPALDTDAAARAWRERTQGLFLVTLACGERHVLVLLTQARGEAAPRPVAWQAFSPATWALVRPRLEKALFG